MILTQRDVRIGDADHRLRQTRQLRRQIVLAADRVSLYPRRDEGASDGNRRNMNVVLYKNWILPVSKESTQVRA